MMCHTICFPLLRVLDPPISASSATNKLFQIVAHHAFGALVEQESSPLHKAGTAGEAAGDLQPVAVVWLEPVA